jgi:SAM-dependent methyltransferase
MTILKHYGIQKHHKLLEFGCGSLRNGIHIIRFLNENSYYGSDCDIDSIKAGILYELPMNDLIIKNPIIKLDNFFNVDFVTDKVDFILSTAVLNNKHFDEKNLINALNNAYSVLNDDGYMIITNFDITNIALVIAKFLRLVFFISYNSMVVPI